MISRFIVLHSVCKAKLPFEYILNFLKGNLHFVSKGTIQYKINSFLHEVSWSKSMSGDSGCT